MSPADVTTAVTTSKGPRENVDVINSRSINRSFNTSAEAAQDSNEYKQFEKATIQDILNTKSAGEVGSTLFCTEGETVFEAVKKMTSHNVGALLVMKPGAQSEIAGIVTERDYLRKIIVQGRSSRSTRVGEIMTEENKLITVTPQTRVLKAMQLMTENRIRHIPVCEDKKMKGMVSIGDVVKAIVEEHKAEVSWLNDFIKGSY